MLATEKRRSAGAQRERRNAPDCAFGAFDSRAQGGSFPDGGGLSAARQHRQRGVPPESGKNDGHRQIGGRQASQAPFEPQLCFEQAHMQWQTASNDSKLCMHVDVLLLACRVNWKPAKASAVVKTGDIISCAGKGRVEVGEIATTKKGRYAVDLVRYL